MSLESSAIYADSKFTKAQELSKAGKIDESIEIYEEVVEAKPDHIQSLMNLIAHYNKKENWGKVIKYCQQVIRFIPNHVNARISLARAFAKKKERYRAIATYQDIIELQSDVHQVIYMELGSLLTSQNDNFDEAISVYEKAEKLHNNTLPWLFYLRYGDVLSRKRLWNKCLSCYQKVVEYQPDFVRSYVSIGDILLKKQQINEAIKYGQKAIEIDPEHFASYRLLGDILVKQNKLNSAVSYYMKALELNPNALHIYRLIGDIFAKQGKQAQAEECYKKLDRAR